MQSRKSLSVLRTRDAVHAAILFTHDGDCFPHSCTSPSHQDALSACAARNSASSAQRVLSSSLCCSFRVAVYCALVFMFVIAAVTLASAHSTNRSLPPPHQNTREVQRTALRQPQSVDHSIPIQERRFVVSHRHGLPFEFDVIVPWPHLVKFILLAILCILISRIRLHNSLDAKLLFGVFHLDKHSAISALSRISRRKLFFLILLRAIVWYNAISIGEKPRVFNQHVIYRDETLPGDKTCKKGLDGAQERINLLWTIDRCIRTEQLYPFVVMYMREAVHSFDGKHHMCVGTSESKQIGRVRINNNFSEEIPTNAMNFPIHRLYDFCDTAGLSCHNVSHALNVRGSTLLRHTLLKVDIIVEMQSEQRPGFNAIRETIDGVQRGKPVETVARDALGAHAALRLSSCYAKSKVVSRDSVRIEKLVFAWPWIIFLVVVEVFMDLGSNLGPSDSVDPVAESLAA